MIELTSQIKWQILIFYRNNLLFMIIGITAFYVAIIPFLNDIGNTEKFVTLLILNDPSIIGFMFMGLSIILEKDQGVFSALSVTPINHHIYLISRALTLSGISMICVWGMVLMAKGTSFNFIHFSVGTFYTCVIFSFVGVFMVSFTTDILQFLLRSIPLMIVMSLPLLNYFEFADSNILRLFPLNGALVLIKNSYLDTPNLAEVGFGYLSIAVWTPMIYMISYRTFMARLVNV